MYLVTNTDEKQGLGQMSFSNLTFSQVFLGISNPKKMQPDKSVECRLMNPIRFLGGIYILLFNGITKLLWVLCIQKNT